MAESETCFIELAGEINANMPQWVVSKVADVINEGGKVLRSARILVPGIAYNDKVDYRLESPSIALMELLQAKDAGSATLTRVYASSCGCASTTSTWNPSR